jgi:hypothetical protein
MSDQPKVRGRQFGPEPKVYAAILDDDTCPACAAQAGLEFVSAGRGTPPIPNPACTHPRGCRCRWL